MGEVGRAPQARGTACENEAGVRRKVYVQENREQGVDAGGRGP